MANVCTRELRTKHTLYVYSAEQINFHQKGANVEASLATLNSGGRELRLLTATQNVFLIKSCCWLFYSFVIPNICHSEHSEYLSCLPKGQGKLAARGRHIFKSSLY